MATLRFRDLAVPVEPERTVLDQLIAARAPVNFLCMGGTCGTCRIRVASGGEHLSSPDESEIRHHLSGDERLACQATCLGTGDVVVEQQ